MYIEFDNTDYTVVVNAYDGAAADGTVVIPDWVTRIGQHAFKNTLGLTHLTLPEGVNVGSGAFSGCKNLSYLKVAEGVNVDRAAFAGCIGLTNMTISTGVRVGARAFINCTGLTHLSIAARVSLGPMAFAHSALTHLTIGEEVSVDEWAFYACSSLAQVTILKGANLIKGTFSVCPNLSQVVISEEVSLGEAVFANCPSLKKIFIDSSDDEAIAHILNQLPGELTTKVVPKSVWEEAQKIKRDGLHKLCHEPRINGLYSYTERGKAPIYTDILRHLNRFLGSDSRYYAKAKHEMETIGLPGNEVELESYKAQVLDVVDKYIRLAQTHKNMEDTSNASVCAAGSAQLGSA